jgi:hypothetical protein
VFYVYQEIRKPSPAGTVFQAFYLFLTMFSPNSNGTKQILSGFLSLTVTELTSPIINPDQRQAT